MLKKITKFVAAWAAIIAFLWLCNYYPGLAFIPVALLGMFVISLLVWDIVN